MPFLQLLNVSHFGHPRGNSAGSNASKFCAPTWRICTLERVYLHELLSMQTHSDKKLHCLYYLPKKTK